MTKAVIYARYSSHGQTEQSIEGQLHDGYAYAERMGYQVVGEYIDRALTGTKDQRPDFQRMILDAEKKTFSVVIVWKLDRFARNRYDSAIYKARLNITPPTSRKTSAAASGKASQKAGSAAAMFPMVTGRKTIAWSRGTGRRTSPGRSSAATPPGIL